MYLTLMVNDFHVLRDAFAEPAELTFTVLRRTGGGIRPSRLYLRIAVAFVYFKLHVTATFQSEVLRVSSTST